MRRRPRDGGLDAAASLRRQPHRGRCDGAVVGEQARYGGAGEASMQPRCGRMEEKWAAQTNSLLAEWAVISTGTSFSLDNPTPVKPTVRLDWYLMVPRECFPDTVRNHRTIDRTRELLITMSQSVSRYITAEA
ncbi:Os09g0471850 [Oryza sativa Japonica Group]|uniref:Os09g0471850 protein n=1 Tax=Oryza sativa subsp. japonica TaxID=39947 RepID=A0A0P0XNV7_ORYSJ|nr:Os09g0471850 [Oryza sativa Japonica Group]